jgi:flagellar hook-associated protein 2
MAGMSLSTGLISGMDTGSLVSQLMQVEANPQTLLKTKLAGTQTDAAAYRAVNTRFDGLRSAAEAVTKAASWTTTKATSSVPAAVTATAGSSALPGSLTFTVAKLATTHSLIGPELTTTVPSTPTTPASATDVPFGAQITVTDAAGLNPQTFAVGGSGSLADAVAAINKNTALGLTATAMQVSDGKFRLQVSAGTTGAAKAFGLNTDTGHTFTALTTGQDAELTVGTTNPFTVRSPTNSFTGLLPDTTITVAATTTTPVTVGVTSDADAVAAKVSALISAANGTLSTVTAYTKSDSKTATLKGDSTLRTLASEVLSAIASAVGADGSAAAAGLHLNRDGTIAFDSAKFTEKLKSDPAFVQRIFAGTPAGPGPNGVTGGGDDVTEVVGIAGRLQTIAKNASDTTTGSLTLLATSKDSTAKDLEVRIADWDLRLAIRKDSLTRQFTAMETALGSLQNKSTWLSAQLSSLPSWSQSAKS